MAKAMTLRLPDEVHEALRRQAFEDRMSVNAIIVDLIRRNAKPVGSCDQYDCWNEPTHVTTPGGFRFCDEHRSKGQSDGE